jgi:hypothetical protein
MTRSADLCYGEADRQRAAAFGRYTVSTCRDHSPPWGGGMQRIGRLDFVVGLFPVAVV